MTFAERLKNTRISLNLSQTELAEKAGISERSIYSYEQTGVIPRTKIIKEIAGALNVSLSYLMGEDETAAPMNLDEELFLANAKNEYGAKGAQEAKAVLLRASALFAGGELSEEAKEIFFQSLMEVYLESKAEARAKFSPRHRISRKK